MNRRPSPCDVSDEEWAFVAPYLSLLRQTAAQRRQDLRDVFHAMRSIVRTSAPWRWLPTNFPPWEAVYQQTRRLLAASSMCAPRLSAEQLAKLPALLEAGPRRSTSAGRSGRASA
jgi:transposase